MKLLTGFFLKLRSRDLNAAVPPAFTTTDGVPLIAECDLYGNQLVLPMMYTAGAGFPAPVPFTSRGNNTDAIAPSASGNLATINYGYIFDGTNFDRERSASAINLSSYSSLGAGITASPGQWSVVNVPAAATQASAVKAAGAVGVRHVCTGISVSFAAGAANEAARTISVLDGATVIWSQQIAVLLSDSKQVNLTGLSLIGSAATSMTLQFDAAGGAGSEQAVTLMGYDAS